MELTLKKDIDPHDYTILKAKEGGEYYLCERATAKPLFFIPKDFYETFVALLAMAGASYNFLNKKGSFADPDDIKNVL